MKVIQFKRGSTLSIKIRFFDKQRNLIILSDLTKVKCQINTKDKLEVCNLGIKISDVTGTYILYTDEDTSEYPLGLCKGDVYVMLNDTHLYSSTFQMDIIDFETPKPIFEGL